MVYKVKTAKINNDGTVVEGKREYVLLWPVKLDVGGLYFLQAPGKLYRVTGIIE